MGLLWQEKSQIFPFRRRVPEPEVHPIDLSRASGAGQRAPRTRFGLVQSGGGAAHAPVPEGRAVRVALPGGVARPGGVAARGSATEA